MQICKFLTYVIVIFVPVLFVHRLYIVYKSIVCSFKFILKIGVEESIVNALWITDHGSAVQI
jgi:hypothetical protein